MGLYPMLPPLCVQRGRKADFIARSRRIALWLDPSSEQAPHEKALLVDKLVHQFYGINRRPKSTPSK